MKGFFSKIGSFFNALTRIVLFIPPFMRKKFAMFLSKRPALERIYNLTGLQMANSARFKTPTTFWKKLLIFIFQIAFFVGLIFLFSGLIILIENYVLASVRSFKDYYLSFVLSVYILFTVIEMSISLVDTLYKARDNALLFVYPVKPGEIFISKLLVKYIKEIKKATFFIVPFLLAFYIQKHAVPMETILWTYILKIVPVFIFLPIFLVLISGIVSILFSLIDTLFKRIPIIKFIVAIAAFIGAFSVLIVIINGLPSNLSLRDLWYKIVVDYVDQPIKTVTPFLICGYSIKTFLVGRTVWLNLVIFASHVSVIALLVVLNMFLSFKFFFKLSGSAVERGSSKVKKTKDKLNKNIFLAFFLKEVKTYFRSEEGTLFNTILVIALPLTVYCLNKIFMIMDISTFGKMLIISVNILISLTIITSVNISSANALSREGENFYLLKTSPLNTSSICYAKILFNAILTVVAAVSIAVALEIVNRAAIGNTNRLGEMDILFIFIITLCVGVGHLFLCFELDLTNPKVKQYAIGDKDTSNITKALVIGIIISALMTVLTFFFLHFAHYQGIPKENLLPKWLSVITISIIFLVSRVILFNKKLNAYFDDIS